MEKAKRDTNVAFFDVPSQNRVLRHLTASKVGSGEWRNFSSYSHEWVCLSRSQRASNFPRTANRAANRRWEKPRARIASCSTHVPSQKGFFHPHFYQYFPRLSQSIVAGQKSERERENVIIFRDSATEATSKGKKSVYQLWCCVQKGRYRRKEPYLASSLCLWESPPSSERRGSQCARKALSWKKEPKRNRGVELTTVEERCLASSLSQCPCSWYVLVAKLLRRREGKPSANGRGTSSSILRWTEWKLKDMGPGSVSQLSGREEEWGDGGRVENKCWKWGG